MHNKNYISVGIDVGSAFSFMTILAPDETVILKPFKITHNNKDSLERAVPEISKLNR
jgi:activator of 2-hydroxyglutaryl-CoA dehydratase